MPETDRNENHEQYDYNELEYQSVSTKGNGRTTVFQKWLWPTL